MPKNYYKISPKYPGGSDKNRAIPTPDHTRSNTGPVRDALSGGTDGIPRQNAKESTGTPFRGVHGSTEVK